MIHKTEKVFVLKYYIKLQGKKLSKYIYFLFQSDEFQRRLHYSKRLPFLHIIFSYTTSIEQRHAILAEIERVNSEEHGTKVKKSAVQFIRSIVEQDRRKVCTVQFQVYSCVQCREH